MRRLAKQCSEMLGAGLAGMIGIRFRMRDPASQRQMASCNSASLANNKDKPQEISTCSDQQMPMQANGSSSL